MMTYVKFRSAPSGSKQLAMQELNQGPQSSLSSVRATPPLQLKGGCGL